GASTAGHAPTGGPSGGAGVRPRLRSLVSHRWVSRVYDGRADPLWALGPATTPPGQRAIPQAALAAPAWAALCASHQDHTPPAAGSRQAPDGVRDTGGRQAASGARGLAEQYVVRGAHQSDHSPACRCRWAADQHAVQGRGGLTPAARLVSGVLQLCAASRERTPARAAASLHQGHGLRQAVAALHASDGRRTDRSRVDAARSAALPRATMAAAISAGKGWQRE